ncbi:MAG: 4-alpha-glucanotransferase, partial [Elusimicrobiales bacterium]|nr:4-alpha-glucanotransferase [Elusimicrobiales bacterium]
DPVFIAVDEVEDVRECDDARRLIQHPEFAVELAALAKSEVVDYARVKALKYKALWAAFNHFYNGEWRRGGPRSRDFIRFREETGWWLNDYAIFRAMKDMTGWKSWTEWDYDMKTRDPAAIAAFRARHTEQVAFFEYLQWVADTQWRAVRQLARRGGVWLFGDLPFMVNQESADVWAHQDIFDISAEIGAPPDQYSAEGQRWGLPAYRWWNLENSNFAWWRARVRRATEIYDLFRLDHLIGFFRTWVVPKDRSQKPHFDYLDERAQQARGERFLRAVIEEAGEALPVAEDLGMVPDFARQTLLKLHIPGYKVMRWETEKDGRFRGPENYPKVSLATTATHDSETLREWWDTMPPHEKEKAWEMISGEKGHHPRFSDKVHDAALRRLFGANSAIALIPVQDIFGMTERINTPGTVGPQNWTWRFPVPVEKIETGAKHRERIAAYREILKETGRLKS